MFVSGPGEAVSPLRPSVRENISEPSHALKTLVINPREDGSKSARTDATAPVGCCGSKKRFPGGRHRRKADSQTVIGAFDQRRVTNWLIRRAKPGNKAFPIFVAVQCGPVCETGTLRFQIRAAVRRSAVAKVEGLGIILGMRLGLLHHPAQLLRGDLAGLPAPQIHRQLASQGDNGLFFAPGMHP